jgi:hypothetical protein
MTLTPHKGRFRGLIALTVGSLIGCFGLAAVFIQLYLTRPEVPHPWATAPDLETVRPLNRKLLWIVVDAMNADKAFDPRVMPFVAGQRKHGAWGIALTPSLTLTGPAIWTMGTGRSPALMEAVTNFKPPPATSDNLFRRMKEGRRRVFLAGEAAWSHRYGQWAVETLALKDRGHHDTHDSDNKAFAATKKYIQKDHPDLLVVHFVGADHLGHPHGTKEIDGPYANRLRELDVQIRELAELAKSHNMAVMVMADHGMTDTGGHGGGEEKPRNAPFVWWGTGVVQGGPTTIPQQAVASTLAAYLGVELPAEAEHPPAFELLAFDKVERDKLLRNMLRQRKAVTGDSTGELPSHPADMRQWGWSLIGLIGLLLLALTFLVLLGVEPIRPASWLFLAIVPLGAAPWLAPLTIAGLAAACLALVLVACWGLMPDKRWGSICALAALLPISTIPLLTWWHLYVPVYAGLVLVIAILGAAGHLNFSGANKLTVTLTITAGVLLAAAVAASHYFDLDVRKVSETRWEALLIAVVGVVVWKSGGRMPGALLAVGVFVAALCPSDSLTLCLLAASVPLLVWLSLQRSVAATLGGVVLLSTLLFGIAQVGVVSIIAVFCYGLSQLPAPSRRGAWLLIVPLVFTVLEVSAYLSMGKAYTFSSVQVALAFVGGKDLQIVRAVLMVTLADVLPWALILIATCHWASRSTDPKLLSVAAAIVVAMMPLRLLMQILIYPSTQVSFWIASAVLPFMAATLVLIGAVLPVLGLSLMTSGGPRTAATSAQSDAQSDA